MYIHEMYIHVYIQVKEEKGLVHTVVDGCRNTIYIVCSGVYVLSDGAPPPEYLQAAEGHWQAPIASHHTI
jgi:hypothetical protein